MTKGIARTLIWLACAAASASGASRAAAIELETGRLGELIERLASSEFVLGDPSRDERPYVDPSPVLNAFRHVASSLAWGDPETAARQAAKVGYVVVRFKDQDTEDEFLVLREDVTTVSTIRGWGSYIVNPASRVDAIVEVPHPKSDLYTPEIGAIIFAGCGARGFLLAGTHRAKADVPDLVDSVFHQVHTAWVGPAGQVAAWQIHGFSSIKHGFPDGAKVVASTGDGAIVPAMANLDAELENRGLASYVFNDLPAEADVNKQINQGVPGATFSSLAAAKNEQGRHSRSLGGSFVHVELEVGVRADTQSREIAGGAIAAVIADAGQRAPAAADQQQVTPTEASAQPAAPAGPATSETEVRLAAKPVAAATPVQPKPAARAAVAP